MDHLALVTNLFDACPNFHAALLLNWPPEGGRYKTAQKIKRGGASAAGSHCAEWA
jgi:hypothetical protein